MSERGHSAMALDDVRRTLAVRDADLSAADRALTEAIAGAHALAAAAVKRIDAVAAQVDAAAATLPTDSPAAARDCARHFVTGTRDVAAVVAESAADVRTKTAALEQLRDFYRRNVSS